MSDIAGCAGVTSGSLCVVQIIFMGERGREIRGDIAIDDVQITRGRCGCTYARPAHAHSRHLLAVECARPCSRARARTRVRSRQFTALLSFTAIRDLWTDSVALFSVVVNIYAALWTYMCPARAQFPLPDWTLDSPGE